jgi:hypothetical protein
MQTLPSFTSSIVLQKSPKNRFLIGSEHVSKILQNAGLNRHLESQFIAACLTFNELSSRKQQSDYGLFEALQEKDQFIREVSISVHDSWIVIDIFNEEENTFHRYKCISHSSIVYTTTTV